MKIFVCKSGTIVLLFFFGFVGNLSAQQNAWINEIHYDNDGADMNEAVEIVIENPGALGGYELYLYNGSDGEKYDNIALNHPDIDGFTVGNFGIYTWNVPLQNGGSDGVALIHNGTLLQFLSYEGTLTASDGPAGGETSTDIGGTEDNNTAAIASLQLTGTGGHYSDFTWENVPVNTFGALNYKQTIGNHSGNTEPVFMGMAQTPSENNTMENDEVNVSVELIDLENDIGTVELQWGLFSSSLSNTISMDSLSDNLSTVSYATSQPIPVHGLGNTIYYQVVATDGNSTIAGPLKSYIPQKIYYGWQITEEDVPFKIDFDNSVQNVNNDQFNGTGFEPGPETGKLDSDTWAISGGEDEDLNFGAVKKTGDYARGVSTGRVGTGGIYAFNTGSSGASLGVQPTGTDFTPGTITLKIQNKTGSTITEMDLRYDVFVYNDEHRSNEFSFSHSPDNINYTSVNSAVVASVQTKNTDPNWERNERNVSFSTLSIPPDDFYYLRWKIDTIGGNGRQDEFALDNILLIANPVMDNYVYDNGWLPSDPSGVATPDDNISVNTGTAILTADTEINNITVDANATLNIEQVLKVNGNITNNGSLVFINDDDKLGQLAAMSTTVNIPGVTVQSYIPAKRAFRLISPSVTTTSNIHDNWQEGATSNTNDPHLGFGTHITGTTTDQANGFDATISGNPSLFLFDNITQAWGPISNTDVNKLERGKAYRLFVRGDRSIDLTNNASVPTTTILRAAGSLSTDDYIDNNLSQTANGFNFIGNPYQAIVNMNDVLKNSTNLNPAHYYVWDPNLNDQGGYVTVNLPIGDNATSSEANQYLQPGQAAFVRTLNDGPASILFEQADKAPFQNSTAVFRGVQSNSNGSIVLQLHNSQNFDTENSVLDGLMIKFNADESNAVSYNDAAKLGNIDENLAVVNGANYLSIENRALPIDGEVLQLFNNQYRHNNYTYKAELHDFADSVRVYLKDDYLGSQNLLHKDEMTLVEFHIDENIPASMANDRFSIVFEVNKLSVEENRANGFKIYPNPSQNGNFFVEIQGAKNEKLQISVHNLLGQQVHSVEKKIGSGSQIAVKNLFLTVGVYIVKLTHQGKTISKKLIVQ